MSDRGKEPLKIGDVVWLKSGSPGLTVAKEPENDRVSCVWFDDEGKAHEAEFAIAALKH